MNSSHRSAIGQSVIWLAGMAFSVGVGESAIAQVPDSNFDAQVPEPIASAPSGTENAVHAASNVTVLHVNSVAGQDQPGSGDSNAPFRSLTHALQVAQPNTVIVLAPGTYSASNGESFPIQLKSGVTIQGNPENSGQDVIIKGGGLYSSPAFGEQNVTMVGADQAGLTGVTVTNTDPKGYGLWIESTSPIVVNNTFHANGYDGVAVAGRANPMLRSNLFAGNGASGVSLFGQAGGTLRNNTFDSNSFGINIAHQARPILVGNRILRNRDGIVVQDEARPALQVNIIEGQERDGLVARANAQPNLGTPEQAGGNIFRSNGRLDINAEAVQTPIPVYGSQFEASAARGKIDVTGAIALNASTSTTMAAAPTAPTSNPFNTTLAEMSRNNQVSVTPINPVTSSIQLSNTASPTAAPSSIAAPSLAAANATSTTPAAASATSATTTQANPAGQAGTSGGSASAQASQSQTSRTESVPPISAMDAWIQNPAAAERPAVVSAAFEAANSNTSDSTAEAPVAPSNSPTEPVIAASAEPDEVEQVAIASPPATPAAANSEPANSESTKNAEVAEEPAAEVNEASEAAALEAPRGASTSESEPESSSNQIAIRIPTPTLPTADINPTIAPPAEPAATDAAEQESAAEQQTTSEEADAEIADAEETATESPSAVSATAIAEEPKGDTSSAPLVTEITIEPILEPAAAQAAATSQAAADAEDPASEASPTSPTSDEPAPAVAAASNTQVAVRPTTTSASNSLVTEIEFAAPSGRTSQNTRETEPTAEPSPTPSAASESTPPATAAVDLQLPTQPALDVSTAASGVDAAAASPEVTADQATSQATSTEPESEANPLPTITSRVAVTDSTSVPALHTPADTSTTTARSHSQLPAAPANEALALATPPQNLTNDPTISIPVPTPGTSSSTNSSSPASTATPEGWPSLLSNREAVSSQRSDNLAVVSAEPPATPSAPAADAPEAGAAEATAEVTVEPVAEPETIAAAPASTVRSLEFTVDAVQDVTPQNSPQTLPEALPEATEVTNDERSGDAAEAVSGNSRGHSDLATAIADRPFAQRSRSADQDSANRASVSQDAEPQSTEREFTLAARADLDNTISNVAVTDATAANDTAATNTAATNTNDAGTDNAGSVREFEFTAPTASASASDTPAASTAVASTATATRREPTLPRLPSRATAEDVLAMANNSTSSARGSLVNTLATRSTPGTETNAISIPVPDAGGADPGIVNTVPNAEAEQIARAIAESEQNALPVPDINIPLARSSVPAVNVSPTATRSPIDPPPPPTRASSLGLGYRLIVDAPSTAEQERLKQHVRDAFRVQYDGRSMMQAGAFRDRTEATAILQMLQESGFSVILAE